MIFYQYPIYTMSLTLLFLMLFPFVVGLFIHCSVTAIDMLPSE